MRTYLKTLVRTFEKHITRFLSIIFIVLVALGFVSGLGTASDKISLSLSDYYKENNVCDFIVKSTAERGFSDDDVRKLEEVCPSAQMQTLATVDVNMPVSGENRLVRLYFLDFDEWTINSIPEYDVLSGKMPENESYALSETSDKHIKGVEIGEKVTLDFAQILEESARLNERELDSLTKRFLSTLTPVEVEISGVVQSPLTFGTDGEPAAAKLLNGEDMEIPDTVGAINDLVCVDDILYISKKVIPSVFNMKVLGTTDIWLASEDRDLFSNFSDGYKKYTDGVKNDIISTFTEDGEEGAKVLTLYDNYSFHALHEYGVKVTLIGYILMIAFFFVTALVVLSSMTRMLDEERPQIACLTTLGYSPMRIIFKYLLFAAIATGVGSGGAYFVGLWLANLIYTVFNYSFIMPPMTSAVAVEFFLIIFAIIVVTALAATLFAGLGLTNEKPAELLRPKPPKSGRKTVLEKIHVIWNRLSFKYKSTVRNVLRYKSRFIMTVVAVAVSTALIMAGLTLLDVCLFRGVESPSIMAISLVIVVFAGLFTAVVIYTLTNINISERNRELATLKVLGYFDGEVSGYIYREIYIDTVIGIIFGYPLSALVMFFLFNIMNAGTYATFMWAVTPVVVLLFTAAVTLLLRRKIVKIDMNESLKAIE